MKSLLLLTAMALLVQNQVLALSEGDYVMMMEKALTLAASEMNISEDQVLAEWETQAKPIGTEFDCSVDDKPPTPPESVHQLTPYDVKVVGALGDSVTAAMGAGAGSIVTDFIEYRGISWSIGGDKDLSEVTTLPNIIKKYNPNVKGFSIKTGGVDSSNARFNVAISGAKSRGMLGQAENLVKKMKADQDVNYEDDWKVVTLFIGANDLCDYCDDNEAYSPAMYIANIQEALDYLHNEIPKTFVNLVQILDVTVIANVNGLVCGIVHWTTCKCAQDAASEVSQAAADYQKEIAALVQTGRYDTRDDFTVVVQPFMIGIHLPLLPDGKPDKSYLAPDCFHFSAKGHREGAIGLWNNMLERVGSKDPDWQPGAELKCPTEENPYFYTSKNSGMQSTAVQSSSSDHVDKSSGGQSEDEANAAGMVAAIFVGVVGFAIFAVVAVIVLNYWRKKRRHTTDEKLPLIQIKN